MVLAESVKSSPSRYAVLRQPDTSIASNGTGDNSDPSLDDMTLNTATAFT
jgi:hypothetical protein